MATFPSKPESGRARGPGKSAPPVDQITLGHGTLELCVTGSQGASMKAGITGRESTFAGDQCITTQEQAGPNRPFHVILRPPHTVESMAVWFPEDAHVGELSDGAMATVPVGHNLTTKVTLQLKPA